jgi:hypothetical protein
MRDLKGRIDANIGAMSSHGDFIARYAPGVVETPTPAPVAV